MRYTNPRLLYFTLLTHTACELTGNLDLKILKYILLGIKKILTVHSQNLLSSART